MVDLRDFRLLTRWKMEFKSQEGLSPFEAKISFSDFNTSYFPQGMHLDFSLHDLLLTAYSLLGKLNGVCEYFQDIDLVEQMFLVKEATASCQIDGSSVVFLDYFKQISEENYEHSNDISYLFNYVKALNYIVNEVKSREVSYELLLMLEQILYVTREKSKLSLNNEQLFCNKGFNLNSSTSFNFTKFANEDVTFPLLLKAGIIHSEFFKIFSLNNDYGKINRIILFLDRQMFAAKIILPLSDYFKNYKKEYIELICFNDEIGLNKWLRYFLSAVINTSSKVIQILNNIRHCRDRNEKKIATLGRTFYKSKLLLQCLYKKPIVKVKDVEKITSLKNPNALKLISKFVSLGILKEITGQKRNRLFVYKDYMDLF